MITILKVFNKKGGRGVLRGPTLEIEFNKFLDTREQELPDSFYPIKKYCWKLRPVKVGLMPVFTCPMKSSLNLPVGEGQVMLTGGVKINVLTNQ